jgi:hypothetical protein
VGLGVPVICTANDAYAPCLRPLKEVAAVYYFKPPTADKLCARLAAIAAAEHIAMDKAVRGGCAARRAQHSGGSSCQEARRAWCASQPHLHTCTLRCSCPCCCRAGADHAGGAQRV